MASFGLFHLIAHPHPSLSFYTGSPLSHRGFVYRLVEATGPDCAALVPDYRLAPENPYPAALEDALASYEYLLSNGVRPESIVFVGDSAGVEVCVCVCILVRGGMGERKRESVCVCMCMCMCVCVCAALVPDYRLAPENPYPAALEDPPRKLRVPAQQWS